MRTESSRVLDTVERSELRDSELALTRDGVENRFAGELTEAETALGAALIRPLVVPNSSFSAELTESARSRAAEAVEDVMKSWERGETIVRAGDRVDEVAWEAIGFFRLNEGGLDVARLVGFAVLSLLVIGLLLTWTWRFRREFWHRNNVLLLLSLLLLFAVFALKLTAGRPWLPVRAAAGGGRDDRRGAARRGRGDGHDRAASRCSPRPSRARRPRPRSARARASSSPRTCCWAGSRASSRSGAATGWRCSSRPGSRCSS